MRKEWESIQGASVGIPVPAANSIGKNLLACKWVYRVKWDGRLKSRLVALGCHQDTLGLNMETASATPKMSTIRLLLALAVQHDLDIDLCDVECAFLNSGLVDSNGDPVEIFMEYPKGFERPGYVSAHASRFQPLLVRRLFVLEDSSRWSHSVCVALGG